eukprot:gene6212-biopygen10077
MHAPTMRQRWRARSAPQPAQRHRPIAPVREKGGWGRASQEGKGRQRKAGRSTRRIRNEKEGKGGLDAAPRGKRRQKEGKGRLHRARCGRSWVSRRTESARTVCARRNVSLRRDAAVAGATVGPCFAALFRGRGQAPPLGMTGATRPAFRRNSAGAQPDASRVAGCAGAFGSHGRQRCERLRPSVLGIFGGKDPAGVAPPSLPRLPRRFGCREAPPTAPRAPPALPIGRADAALIAAGPPPRASRRAPARPRPSFRFVGCAMTKEEEEGENYFDASV